MSHESKALTLPAKRYLSGEDGARLRIEFNMDELDHSPTLVPIIVPDIVRDIDQEFVETFFLPTARKGAAGKLALNPDLIGPYALRPEFPITEIKRGTNYGEVTHRISRILQNHIFGNNPEAMAIMLIREGHVTFDTAQSASSKVQHAANMKHFQLASDLHEAFFGAPVIEADNAAGDASHYGFRNKSYFPG